MARQDDLLRRAGVQQEPRAVQQMTLAADQFIVARPVVGAPPTNGRAEAASGRTIIAGYHWFNDWGRDTMIALPGLTLATGRPEDAACDRARYVDLRRGFRMHCRAGPMGPHQRGCTSDPHWLGRLYDARSAARERLHRRGLS